MEPETPPETPTVQPAPAPEPVAVSFETVPKAKRHWAKLCHAAAVANVEKTLIQELWAKLDDFEKAGLLVEPPHKFAVDAAQRERSRLLAEKKRWRERERSERAQQERTVRQQQERQAGRRQQRDKAETPLERFKIMLWAIDMCGDPNLARVAFEAAATSVAAVTQPPATPAVPKEQPKPPDPPGF